MANETYGRTYKIDTSGATLIASGPFHVQFVLWVNANGQAGDSAVIQDSNNKVLWEKRANGANFTPPADVLNAWWNQGWKVPTLTRGTLYVVVA